jgi:hypothetical protein
VVIEPRPIGRHLIVLRPTTPLRHAAPRRTTPRPRPTAPDPVLRPIAPTLDRNHPRTNHPHGSQRRVRFTKPGTVHQQPPDPGSTVLEVPIDLTPPRVRPDVRTTRREPLLDGTPQRDPRTVVMVPTGTICPQDLDTDQ